MYPAQTLGHSTDLHPARRLLGSAGSCDIFLPCQNLMIYLKSSERSTAEWFKKN